jgi:hypothetical protein
MEIGSIGFAASPPMERICQGPRENGYQWEVGMGVAVPHEGFKCKPVLDRDGDVPVRAEDAPDFSQQP